MKRDVKARERNGNVTTVAVGNLSIAHLGFPFRPTADLEPERSSTERERERIPNGRHTSRAVYIAFFFCNTVSITTSQKHTIKIVLLLFISLLKHQKKLSQYGTQYTLPFGRNVTHSTVYSCRSSSTLRCRVGRAWQGSV